MFFTDTGDSSVFNANGEETVTSTVNNESIVAEANNDSMEIIPLTYSEICNFSNLEKGLARTKSGKSAGLDGDVKATWTQSKLEKLALENKPKLIICRTHQLPKHRQWRNAWKIDQQVA